MVNIDDYTAYKDRLSGRVLLDRIRKDVGFSTRQRGQHRDPAIYKAWYKESKEECVAGITHACHAALMSGGKPVVTLQALFGVRYTGPIEEANRYWAWLFGEDSNLPPPYPHVLEHVHEIYKDESDNYIGFFLDMSDCNHEAVRHFLILSRGPHEMWRTVRAWNLLVNHGLHPLFALWLAHQFFIVKRSGAGQNIHKWKFYHGTNASGHIYMPYHANGDFYLRTLDPEEVHKPDERLYKNTKKREILAALDRPSSKKECTAIQDFLATLSTYHRSKDRKDEYHTVYTPIGNLLLRKSVFVLEDEEEEKTKKKKPETSQCERVVKAAIKLQKELFPDVA